MRTRSPIGRRLYQCRKILSRCFEFQINPARMPLILDVLHLIISIILILIHSTMEVITRTSSLPTYPCIIQSNASLTSFCSSTTSPSMIHSSSKPTVLSNVLPFSLTTIDQPFTISSTTPGIPAPTEQASQLPQHLAQRQQGEEAMTFGGAVYSTVLAGLGMEMYDLIH